VVGDADEITVWLSDQRSYEATLVGRDPTTDVAVIQIEGDDLPVVRWGSSDDLDVGEWVMAIGNPGFGGTGPLDYTVTTGIVSAKDRPLQLIGRSLAQDPEFGEALAGYAIENFIQTDAVINPGNSGGPLVDLDGLVVGINTAIASTTGYYQGYGFAVPADLARRVVEDLIEDGRVQRAWLGVSVTAVAAEDADVYGLPGIFGALVQEVTEGGPADEAGLRPEDVIVAVDGEPVYRGGNLQQLVAERRPRQEVVFSIYRDGTPREIEVELGELPMDEAEAEGGVSPTRPVALERLGMEVQNMTSELARSLGYEDASGVIVSSLEPLGPAARRGVARGLKVLEVNGTEVESTGDIDRALLSVEQGTVVSLLLQSPDGRTRIANVRTR
jgi:serine protease Do